MKSCRRIHLPHALSHAITWVLAIALVLMPFCPVIGLSRDSMRAFAATESVHLNKVGNINYTDGAWNAHIFRANDGEGETVAYCVQPEKNSPPVGNYAKAPINCVSDRNFEMRVDLWFCFGGPGFDKAMWPAENWDGNPMSDEDYYLASHILLSDTYASNGYEATYGAGERFRNWFVWNITGLDINTGAIINANAVARQAFDRCVEIPSRFEVYQIYGGSCQNIATSSFYRPYGNIRIDKDSSQPEITDGNPNYSMKGIRYGIYTQRDCSEASSVGKELVLDANGCAQVNDLVEGTYYIREIQGSTSGSGYAYNGSVYSCDVVGDQTALVQTRLDSAETGVFDAPITKPPHILLQKHDVLTQSSTPSGDASMANARFELSYYANGAGLITGAPTRTWVLKTDDDGKIDLRNNANGSFVSGDALYRSPKDQSIVFPIGTYAIRELSAPDSYEPASTTKTTVFNVAENEAGGQGSSSANVDEGMRIDEVPVRHDLLFTKKDADTQRSLANIPFLVSRVKADGTVIEEHVIMTDANGIFDSSASHALHTTRTNANDAAIAKSANGTIRVDEKRLDADAGVWFGVARNGTWVAPDDSYGAFPDSTTTRYVFEELPVKANAGKALISFEAYAHGARATSIDLGTVHNSTPTLATTALDALDGDKVVSQSDSARVTDTVSYSGLVAGRTYSIEGSVVREDDGEPVYDKDGNEAKASARFKASASSGTLELDFGFDATALADGARLVVCETLYEGDRMLAIHDDLADGAQTVTVVNPALSTSATDAVDGDSIIVGDTQAVIVDCVSYSGLVPGATYTLSAIVMDKGTGQPFDGPEGAVTASVTFTASESTGTQDVPLALNASELPPQTQLVVFERLTLNGVDIAAHEDIDDAGQTVTVIPPSLATHATNPDDGGSVVSADTKTVLVDTVSFAGLTPGRQYALEASLIDKETGEPIHDADGVAVTATHSFTPIERDGTTDVRIEFDASHLEDAINAVVYEELYRDGRHLAGHADLNSTSQTIAIEPPTIQTFASTDGASRTIMHDSDVELVDSVSYRGLKPGASYALHGTVMSKETGEAYTDGSGNEVISTCTFSPEASNGVASVRFSFDTLDLAEGDQLVVFEKLVKDEAVLVSHESLDDVRQTVTVKDPELSTTATSRNDTKEVTRDTATTIVDTVTFSGLTPDRPYVLSGKVIDKATGETLADARCDYVEAQVQFTPHEASGTQQLAFTFDASDLEEGTELVVFEKLLKDGVEIAAHEDMDDEGQTVRIVSCPISTQASDPADGDKVISAIDHARVNDSVAYSDLEPGARYELVGTLMSKETEEPLLAADGKPIVARKSFVPPTSSGTIDVDFEFDASDVTTTQDVVIFQELYRDESLIATHADLDNQAQTVTLETPRVATSAADADDGDKTLAGSGIVTIVDVVDYSGLVPGDSYELDGTLMIDDGTLEGTPATDALGRQVAAHVTFVPEASHGSVDVSFELDAGLVDDSARIVAFEKLYHNRTLIASHADLQDEGQTVYMPDAAQPVPEEELPDDPNPLAAFGSVAKTGDVMACTLAACAFIGIVAFAMLAALRRKAFGSHGKRS